MSIRLLAAALAALTGCATPAPVTVQRVQVPVIVPCAVEIPARPSLIVTPTWARTQSEHARAQALMVDRIRLTEHVAMLEEVLRACLGGVELRPLK